MKTISAAMREHLDQDVTTLCTCWRVECRDGSVLGFTDHDQDLLFNGLLHKAQTGYTRSAMTNSAGTDSGDMEVDGILDDVSITRDDLRNGVYDFAKVSIHLVNWSDPDSGAVLLRKGYFGEVTVQPSGEFNVQLQPLMNKLRQNAGEVFQRECRASFGDSRCKIKVEAPVRVAGKAYGVGERVRVPASGVVTSKSIALLNPSFEDGTDSWTGDFRTSPGTTSFLPASGALFAMGRAANGSFYQVFDLASLGAFMDQEFIDAGQRRIELTYQLAVDLFGWEGRAGLAFFDEDEMSVPATVSGADDTAFDAYHAPDYERVWKERKLEAIVPATKRYMRVRMSWRVAPYHPGLPATGNPDDFGLACFDAISAVVTDTAFLADDPRLFGGVEWQCATAGVSSSADVDFWTGAGSIADGGVVWDKISPPYQRLGTILSGSGDQIVISDLDAIADGYFDGGTLEVLDGSNKGFRMEIEKTDHDGEGHLRLRLFLPLPRAVEPDASVRIVRGCAKTTSACAAYGNIKNYRGEPHVPGTDRYLMFGNPLG